MFKQARWRVFKVLVTLLIWRQGQRSILFMRQIFFKDVVQVPRALAACDSGK
jgi:hypothetical protein